MIEDIPHACEKIDITTLIRAGIFAATVYNPSIAGPNIYSIITLSEDCITHHEMLFKISGVEYQSISFKSIESCLDFLSSFAYFPNTNTSKLVRSNAKIFANRYPRTPICLIAKRSTFKDAIQAVFKTLNTA